MESKERSTLTEVAAEPQRREPKELRGEVHHRQTVTLRPARVEHRLAPEHLVRGVRHGVDRLSGRQELQQLGLDDLRRGWEVTRDGVCDGDDFQVSDRCCTTIWGLRWRSFSG